MRGLVNWFFGKALLYIIFASVGLAVGLYTYEDDYNTAKEVANQQVTLYHAVVCDMLRKDVYKTAPTFVFYTDSRDSWTKAFGLYRELCECGDGGVPCHESWHDWKLDENDLRRSVARVVNYVRERAATISTASNLCTSIDTRTVSLPEGQNAWLALMQQQEAGDVERIYCSYRDQIVPEFSDKLISNHWVRRREVIKDYFLPAMRAGGLIEFDSEDIELLRSDRLYYINSIRSVCERSKCNDTLFFSQQGGRFNAEAWIEDWMTRPIEARQKMSLILEDLMRSFI